jgi:PIN domain nuclease of toxin-antitoxin system
MTMVTGGGKKTIAAGKFKVVKPITSEIAVAAMELPPSYPGDPMDRIIGATALVEGLKLITSDAMIQRSKAVQTIW